MNQFPTTFYLDDDGNWFALIITTDGGHEVLRIDNADFERLSLKNGLSEELAPAYGKWVYLKGAGQ